jgi:hypothetical protein
LARQSHGSARRCAILGGWAKSMRDLGAAGIDPQKIGLSIPIPDRPR